MTDIAEHQRAIMEAVNETNARLKAAARDGFLVELSVSPNCPSAGREYPILSTLAVRKPKPAKEPAA